MTEFLGRERYARGERDHEGQRNGYTPITVKTTAGPVTLARPKLRGNADPFASRLLGVEIRNQDQGPGVTGDRRLPPGLSTRDVEATLEEALGEQAALSKSTMSRICQVLVSQFELWQRRDLSDHERDYLFADASFFKYHPTAKGEPILCTWGITTEGCKVFIHLSAGAAESYDSWQAHFSDLRERGLRPPLLGVTDGAPGLVSAYEQVLPKSLRQRCAIHAARNLLEKVSKPDQDEVKADYWAIFNDIEDGPGEEAISIAQARAAKFAQKSEARYPRAVR